MQAPPTGPPVTLPRWLQLYFLAVAEAPWTNLKSWHSELLTFLTASFLAVASVFQWSLDATVLGLWLGFLAGKIGFAFGGAWVKRATYKPAPPYGPDVEDAAAGATTSEHPAVKPAKLATGERGE